MKRFHLHLHVNDLQASIHFYTRLFATDPSRVETDYAKWMLEDPKVNFAISTRGSKPGLDHLGFQTETTEELAQLKAQAVTAEMALTDEGDTTCCYARSEKHWIMDPQGIPWEHFHTLGNIPVFNESDTMATGSACCAPNEQVTKTGAVTTAASTCCTPAPVAKTSCCGSGKATSCC
jgi:hypothetical protein